MRIAIIGVGNVGKTLAKRFGRCGHSIFLGSRNPEHSELRSLAETLGPLARCVSVQEALEASELIVLATPWSAVDSVLHEHQESCHGKILIDCTNPLLPDLSGLQFSGLDSGGEHIQRMLPETHVIKAFNTVGFNVMEQPESDGRKLVMYYCGNHGEARRVVGDLIQELGFQALDAGDMKSARLLESFALLWISTAYKFGVGRNFGFSLLRLN